MISIRFRRQIAAAAPRRDAAFAPLRAGCRRSIFMPPPMTLFRISISRFSPLSPPPCCCRRADIFDAADYLMPPLPPLPLLIFLRWILHFTPVELMPSFSRFSPLRRLRHAAAEVASPFSAFRACLLSHAEIRRCSRLPLFRAL